MNDVVGGHKKSLSIKKNAAAKKTIFRWKFFYLFDRKRKAIKKLCKYE